MTFTKLVPMLAWSSLAMVITLVIGQTGHAQTGSEIKVRSTLSGTVSGAAVTGRAD